MNVEYVIRCDICDNVVDAWGKSAAEARRVIREHGQGCAGRRDLCIQHTPEGSPS